MSKGKMNHKNKKFILIGAIGGALLLFLIIVFLYVNQDKITGTPTLKIETPQKISLSQTDEFTVDVTLASMGEDIYPAASMSIAFDTLRLELVSVEEGNVFVRSDEAGVAQKLPEWSVNPDQSNKTGKINIMYLDTTGGKNAFCKELLKKEDNVVLRLRFRLRGSAATGDVYDIVFDDAIFAASDEKQSLAMLQKTLKTKNGKIIVGE